MICPYRHELETTLQIGVNPPEPNEENTITHYSSVAMVFFKDAQCLRGDCAAFYDGRCHYKE